MPKAFMEENIRTGFQCHSTLQSFMTFYVPGPHLALYVFWWWLICLLLVGLSYKKKRKIMEPLFRKELVSTVIEGNSASTDTEMMSSLNLSMLYRLASSVILSPENQECFSRRSSSPVHQKSWLHINSNKHRKEMAPGFSWASLPSFHSWVLAVLRWIGWVLMPYFFLCLGPHSCPVCSCVCVPLRAHAPTCACSRTHTQTSLWKSFYWESYHLM